MSSSVLEFSSTANLFPLMSDDEFAALKDDIRQHGQLEPIWTREGEIIDGRNRYRACLELGIEPITREWNGTGSVVDFAVSANLHRRHLSSGQKAVIALAIEKHLAREAKDRQGTRTDIGQKVDGSFGRADAQVAALVGTNRQYVSDAKTIRSRAPELLPLVRDGELTIQVAKEISEWPSKKHRDLILTELRTGKPLKEAEKPAKEAVRRDREELDKAAKGFTGGLRRAAFGDDHENWSKAQEWDKALARSYVLIRKAPELDDVAHITRHWKVKKKQVRLGWIREIQAKLEKIAGVLEQEVADNAGFDDQEFEEYFRKEMNDFDPNDFGK